MILKEKHETSLGERDRWKVEVESLRGKLIRQDFSANATIKQLQTEARLIRERLSTKKSSFRDELTDASAHSRGVSAEAAKWKDEYHKQQYVVISFPFDLLESMSNTLLSFVYAIYRFCSECFSRRKTKSYKRK
jgi:hypothetical protein